MLTTIATIPVDIITASQDGDKRAEMSRILQKAPQMVKNACVQVCMRMGIQTGKHEGGSQISYNGLKNSIKMIETFKTEYPQDIFTMRAIAHVINGGYMLSEGMKNILLSLLPEDFYREKKWEIDFTDNKWQIKISCHSRKSSGFYEISFNGTSFPLPIHIDLYSDMDHLDNHHDECPQRHVEVHDDECPLGQLLKSCTPENSPEEWEKAEGECYCSTGECYCESQIINSTTITWEKDNQEEEIKQQIYDAIFPRDE